MAIRIGRITLEAGGETGETGEGIPSSKAVKARRRPFAEHGGLQESSL